MSVFSINYWINKGYTEDEAKYQISIRRPNNLNYWINKGYTEDEAKIKISESQSKRGEKRKNMPLDEKRKLSPRCVEFWLNKGFDEIQAKGKLSEQQSTFSKEKCIEKYGELEGLTIWQDRQDRWQKTLNFKSKNELTEINQKKNRWKNLSEKETTALKHKVSNSIKNTVEKRSIEESRLVGKRIREGMVNSGRALSEELIDEFKLYKSKVWAETNRNNLSLLENYDLRGKNLYHLDHVYSIRDGFTNKVSPEIIGHICNLRMIPYKENLSKHAKSDFELETLTNLIQEYLNFD